MTKYIFKIFRLILLGIGITYVLACLWYILVSNDFEGKGLTFYTLIDKPENTKFMK